VIWIGVDAHTRVHAAVALGSEGLLGHTTVPNTPTGWGGLVAWAGSWPERTWAVEGSGALGRGLAQFLAERGERVHEAPPKWTALRRRTMRRPGKSDRLDAHAVARLLREEADALPLVLPDEPETASVERWSRLRDDVVADMTRLRNRLRSGVVTLHHSWLTRYAQVYVRSYRHGWRRAVPDAAPCVRTLGIDTEEVAGGQATGGGAVDAPSDVGGRGGRGVAVAAGPALAAERGRAGEGGRGDRGGGAW
jgi:hypothetical protein